MLKIVNNMIVSSTPEGMFELSNSEAHSFITKDMLEILSDKDAGHLRDNANNIYTMYKIGERLYKSDDITEKQTNDDLMPLIRKLVDFEGDGRLAMMVMQYIIREYHYKITKKHEIESLYNFYYAMRDPVFTMNLKPDLNTDLYHRFAFTFFNETENLKELYQNVWRDYEIYNQLFDDYQLFWKAVWNNTPIPEYKPFTTWCSMNAEIVIVPMEITLWACTLQREGYLSDEDAAPFRNDLELCKMVKGQPHEYDDDILVDGAYRRFKKKRSPLRMGYEKALKCGFYAAAYFVAQSIASDRLKLKIAKNLGVDKIQNYHISRKRLIKRLIKLVIIGILAFIAYKIILGIRSFFGDAICGFLIFVFVGIFTPSADYSPSASMSPVKRKMIENGGFDPIAYYINDTLRGEALYLLYSHGYVGFFDW